ncbi:MAG: hypothetical protein ACOC3D_12700 [Pseudomonadota bacterium]
MAHQRSDRTDAVEQHRADPTARRTRHWLFVAWFVGTCSMFLAALGFGRFLEPGRIGMVETVLVFPILHLTLFLASVAWLAWLVFVHKREPPAERER